MQDTLSHNKTYAEAELRCSKPNCHYCDLMNRKQRDDIPFRKNGWSANDLARLEADYPDKPTYELCEVFKRSATAIMYKASEQGIKKRKKHYRKGRI